MSKWNDGARKAAEEILDMHSDFSMCPELKQGAIDESAEFIAKHFADLKATHEKLVELAKLTPQIIEMNMQMAEMLYGRDEEGGIPIPQIVSVADSIISDPIIQATIKENQNDQS